MPPADNTKITTLNISANSIGDRGAGSLAEMIKSNKSLESLDISSNNIDYDGITALSAAIAENKTLRSLYIRCFAGLTISPDLCNLVGLCLAHVDGNSLHACMPRISSDTIFPEPRSFEYLVSDVDDWDAVTTTLAGWVLSCWLML